MFSNPMNGSPIPSLLYRWFGVLRCPQCHGKLSLLVQGGTRALRCTACTQLYAMTNGIPCLLQPERASALEEFCGQYDALRLQEGWASEHPEFYAHLPQCDVTGRHIEEWRLRAKSFQVVQAWLEKFADGRALRILEVGAGSGWMSQKLGTRHEVLACDVNAGRHGLGALPATQRCFMAVQAELTALPLADHAFDLIIANASLHYASEADLFFDQACRVLRPSGRLLVMDSPVYPEAAARAAAHARTRAYYARAGFPELAQNYSGLFAAQFENRRDFRFSRLRRDFTKQTLLKKYLREKLGRESAARFPIYIGESLSPENESWQPGRGRAGALIIQEQKLLTYNVQGDRQYWRIPGGGVEPGETPEQAARRELREELSLEVTLQLGFGPYFSSRKNHWYFLASTEAQRLPRENAAGFEEACTVNWLPLHKLAEYDIQPPGLKWELVDYFEDSAS